MNQCYGFITEHIVVGSNYAGNGSTYQHLVVVVKLWLGKKVRME